MKNEDPSLSRIDKKAWLGTAVFLVFAGCCALCVDLSIARWFLARNCPDFLHEILVNAEPFAHGVGVSFIVLAIFLLDPPKRWALPRLILAVASAGIAANVVKLMISRTRPNAFDFNGGVWESFNHWLPLASQGGSQQSIPSAHAATAVALALALAWLYPRGRWLFAALALLAAAQRVEIGVHFLSDVCWGAALGWFFGAGVINGRLTPRVFDRREDKRSAAAAERWGRAREPGLGRTAAANDRIAKDHRAA